MDSFFYMLWFRQDRRFTRFHSMLPNSFPYNWEPDLRLKRSQLKSLVERVASVPVQDRARQTIIAVVRLLDSTLQGIR